MIFAFGEYELDVDRHELRRAGDLQAVEPQVFDVLVHLVRNRDRMVGRDELLDAVWGHRFLSPGALDSRIRSARQAVGDDGARQAVIRTVRGRGYRFVAEVRASGETDGAAVSVAAGPAPATQAEGCVRRPSEASILARAFDEAMAGRRRLVLLTGEAGIGKSTLVRLFLAGLGPGPAIARGQCVEQHGSGEPLLPVLDALGRLHRQVPHLDVSGHLEQWAPALLLQLPALVGPAARRELAAGLTDATRRHVLRQAVEGIEALARAMPLVLVIEDLHWSDPSTLDLLAWLADRTEPARLLVVATCRQTDPGPMGRAAVRRIRGSAAARWIAVAPFDRSDVARLLEVRFPGSGLDADLAGLLVERTGGNPLFAQSLLDAWVESGALVSDDDTWRLAVPASELADALPDSLRDSVGARVARLPAGDRRALAAASVAGVEFAAALVAEALGESAEAVEERLHRIARRGWILRIGGTLEWPDGTVSTRFAFDHQVHREVLYGRLSRSRRRRLHRAIGLRLERGFAADPGGRAAELAVHFTHARDAERAVRYLRMAAERALGRGAHAEAGEFVRSALSLIRRAGLPDAEARELELLPLRAAALLEMRGWADPRVERAYERARELALALDDDEQLGNAVYALAYVHETRGDYPRALRLVEERLALAEQVGDPVARIEANDLLSCSLQHQGRFEDAVAAADRALALADAPTFVSRATPFGHHPVVSSHYWAGLCQWLLGFPDSGAARVQRAVEIADRLGHPGSRAFARSRAARICCFRREPALAEPHARAAIAVADAHDLLYQRAIALPLLGWARALLGDAGPGMDLILEGLALQHELGAAMDRPFALGLLAEARLADGRVAAALEALDEAAAVLEDRAPSFFWHPELERLRAVALFRGGRTAAALDTVRGAIASAARTGARILELRARTECTRMLPAGPERTASAAALRSLCDTFDEGFDTPDLVQARTLAQSPVATGSARG